MADPVGECLNLVVTDGVTEVGESFLAARERNPFLLSGWSVQARERMAGQCEMGEADENQMPVDSVPAKHLILAEPQAAQFLEQDFDRPASFVNVR